MPGIWLVLSSVNPEPGSLETNAAARTRVLRAGRRMTVVKALGKLQY